MTRLASFAMANLLLLGALPPSLANAQANLSAISGEFNVPVTSLREIPFRTVVRQQYDYSCGSAALATLLTYQYGDHVSEAEIFKAMYAIGDQAKIQKVGFSLLDLKKYLESRGYRADGYRLNAVQLTSFDRPGIAVVSVGDYRHFVVIKGVRNGKILVGDPAGGLRTFNAPDFEKIWNGIVFAIEPTPQMKVVWNKTSEWSPWAKANLSQPLSDDSLASLSRVMPPIYQITPMIYSNAAP